MIAAIKAAGFDGLVYQNVWEGGTDTANEDSYVAFHPHQIKSVFNRGTFDPASACMLE